MACTDTAIYDGKGTTITFGTSTTFILEMVRLNPGGQEVADIDVTHLGNTGYKTKKAAALKESAPITFDAHYDPSVTVPYGVNEVITITFPDGGTKVVQGFLQTLDPGDAVEGDKMTCTGSITVSNLNGSCVETGPVYTAAT